MIELDKTLTNFVFQRVPLLCRVFQEAVMEYIGNK